MPEGGKPAPNSKQDAKWQWRFIEKKTQLHDAMLEDDPAWIYLEMQEEHCRLKFIITIYLSLFSICLFPGMN